MGAIIDTPVASTINTVSTTSTTKTDDVNADSDKFMKLLVTQLQNQDPLNPMDNAAMTSQLAQLSTVTGINKVNATLESLRTDQASAQSLTATNLIGKGVLAAGNTISLQTSAAVFGVDLSAAADNVEVDIVDKSGAVVRTMNLTQPDIGTYPLTWDGKTDAGGTAADGDYSFKVKATSNGKEIAGATALMYGNVASVSTGSGGVKLNIPAIGQLTMADIKEVL